jgi:biopolymer transport protein ExbB
MGTGAFAQEAAGYVPPEAQITVTNVIKWGGWIGIVIILHSVAAVALIIEHFMNVKREKIVPPEIVDEIEALFEEEEYQEALELCESEPNYLTNMLASALPKLNAGFDTSRWRRAQVSTERPQSRTKPAASSWRNESSAS